MFENVGTVLPTQFVPLFQALVPESPCHVTCANALGAHVLATTARVAAAAMIRLTGGNLSMFMAIPCGGSKDALIDPSIQP